MKHTIENGVIRFVSDSFNIEPWYLGFVDEEVNYFWRPAELKKLGTAICFPLLGSLEGGRYTLDGREHIMPMHGFASEYDYTVVKKTDDAIVYEITDDEATYAIYPYHFRLQVAYSVQVATLRTEYRVLNQGNEDMYFSVGGHPRYACPAGGNGAFAEHYVEFEKPQGAETIVKHNAPRGEIEACWFTDGKGFQLDARAFNEGCFCVHPVTCGAATLKSRGGSRSLRMDAWEWTHLQFWTPINDPYFCIEPWFGSITSVPQKEKEEDWKERAGTRIAKPGEEVICAYEVTIGR